MALGCLLTFHDKYNSWVRLGGVVLGCAILQNVGWWHVNRTQMCDLSEEQPITTMRDRSYIYLVF